jgi:hypothetical protein
LALVFLFKEELSGRAIFYSFYFSTRVLFFGVFGSCVNGLFSVFQTKVLHTRFFSRLHVLDHILSFEKICFFYTSLALSNFSKQFIEYTRWVKARFFRDVSSNIYDDEPLFYLLAGLDLQKNKETFNFNVLFLYDSCFVFANNYR